MLEEIARKYYKLGYNCAESIVHAGNEFYHLNLHEHDMIMVAAFGGGLQLGDICGALSGSCCIISSKYVETKAHDCEDLKELTQKLVIRFQQRFNSRLCAKIKSEFFDKELHCENTVAIAASILEDVIKEWEESHNNQNTLF